MARDAGIRSRVAWLLARDVGTEVITMCELLTKDASGHVVGRKLRMLKM